MPSTDTHACYMYNAERKTKVFQLFSHHLIEYIHEESEEELLGLLQNPECLEVIQEYSYEVLEVIIMIMNEEHKINKIKINHMCGKVMAFLATHCHANELILYLVEQIELKTIKPYFQYLFDSLHLCLLRCKNLVKMLEMCTDAINRFLKNLPLPSDEFNKDRNDHVTEEIVLSCIYVTGFIDNIHALLLHNTPKMDSAVDLKCCLFKLVLSILDDKFNHLDLNNNTCRLVFHKILNIFCSEYDIIQLIYLKNNKLEIFANHGSNEHVEKDCLSEFKHYYPLLNIDYVQLSNLGWIILCTEEKNAHIPCIYDPIYITLSIMQLSNNAIRQSRNQSIVILRVLDLVDFALNMNQLPLPMECIDSIVHGKFMQNIMDLAVSSNSVKVQKHVINKFIQYINKFEIKAKYRILQKVITLNCHVKIIGIAIVLFKDTVAQSCVNDPKDDKERLFYDNNLQEFISKICQLKDGVDTDLIEMSDQIIPTLNFVIFFVIRKKGINRDMQLLCASHYEFFKLLNQLITVQLKEWKSYLDNMDENFTQDQHYFKKLRPSMKTMSVMPKNQQIFMCHQATNTLFIIQDLINRICELTNFSILEECDMKSV